MRGGREEREGGEFVPWKVLQHLAQFQFTLFSATLRGNVCGTRKGKKNRDKEVNHKLDRGTQF